MTANANRSRTRTVDLKASRRVRVLLFATAREAVGRSVLEWPVPSGGLGVRSLLDSLLRQYARLHGVLPSCRLARNGRYLVGRDGRLRPGDELAIHPPYSGG